jgi:hypothetical protein
MTMTAKTVDQLIKGMPGAQQGRGRTLYQRGRSDSAAEIGEIILANAALDDGELLHLISAWVKEEKEK